MPAGGHENCPRPRPTDLPTWGLVALAVRSLPGLVHRGDTFPGEGLSEPDRVARGLADVGMVQELVDGRGREGLRHELIKTGAVQVRDRDRPFLVGGVDEPVEPFGGVRTHFEQANIVDHDQVGAEDAGDDPADGVVGPVGAYQRAEILETEPGDPHPSVDDFLAEGLEEERLPGPRGSADGDVKPWVCLEGRLGPFHRCNGRGGAVQEFVLNFDWWWVAGLAVRPAMVEPADVLSRRDLSDR
jgi:hypothetical protein